MAGSWIALLLLFAADAHASNTHTLTGNARFQGVVLTNLPIPLTPVPPPVGAEPA